ncbi:MAG: glycosyltransferase family 87 protein [Bryobacteraceae bacterium]
MLLFGGFLDFQLLRPAVTRPADDFAQFYFVSQLVSQGKTAQIYTREAYQPLLAAVNHGDYREVPFYYFNRPAFAALLYWPYSFLTYKEGSRVFVALNFLLWGLMIWKLPVWLEQSGLVRVWMISLFPLGYSVAVGQDTLAITLLLAYAMCVLIHRNETAAGVLLGLCLIKPHLLVFMPFVLWIEGKHRALTSFLATGALLAGLSLALVGIDGIEQWIDLLRAPTTDFRPEVMGTIRALGLQFGGPVAWAAGVIALGAGVFGFLRGSYGDRLSIALLLALLLSPHAYWADYASLAIVALTTRNPIIRYTILIPWVYFLPLPMWPMVLCSIGFLILFALDSLPKRSQVPTGKAFSWKLTRLA